MEISILKDIVVIFALSTLVNFLFTKIKIPTIIGYLITGVIAGPNLLAIIELPHEIDLMAEIGVVLLMFTIGLEFSLNHLFKIRRIVFVGGFIQLILTAGVTMFVSRIYGLNWTAAVFIGFITSLSSTAVVLKILQERSELSSNYGRTVLGILIFQDLIIVPFLLFTPLLGSGENNNIGSELLLLLLKTIGIIGFVYIGNKWLMPKLLHLIALTKNQELFLMCVLLICLSVALLTSSLGMSLAIGAFLAGLMISETEYSHNAFGHLIPFKNTFSSFFFVSIGMLLNLNFVIENISIVLITVLIVITVKSIIAGGTGFLLGHTFRGTVLVGIALSQVGEFSFILAKIGLDHTIISSYYYHLFLAVAVITMSISPLLIQAGRPLANYLMKLPLPSFVVNGLFPLPQVDVPDMKNHIVLIGKDSRSHNLAKMAKHSNLPYISIVFDPVLVRERQKKGEIIVYGDAVNEPILQKAHIDTAEVVVVSVGDLITAMAVTEKVRAMNKHTFIIVRTKHVQDIEELYKIGANQVIPEEFETAINLFERVLVKLLLPRNEIEKSISNIRNDNYGVFRESNENKKTNLFKELPNIEISAVNISKQSVGAKKMLNDLHFRSNFGVLVVAIKRENKLIEHPGKSTILEPGDIVYLLGNPDKIGVAVDFLYARE
jgi:CPA2 family monovalent cation:H+ antiporter-2